MSSYNPRTLLRLTTADGSKHCTAVVLKNGTLFEVKNEISAVRERFETLEAWQQARGTELLLTTSPSKPRQTSVPSIPEDTKGFNYPDHNKYSTNEKTPFGWLQWVYSMILEAAPQLLENETLKEAYNKMVAITTEHADDIYLHRTYTHPTDRYTMCNLIWHGAPNHPSTFRGYSMCFKSEYLTSNYPGKPLTKYDILREQILKEYKTIVEIVRPAVSDYIQKHEKILDLKPFIRSKNQSIRYFEKKVKQLKAKLAYREKNSHREVKNVSGYKWNLEWKMDEAQKMIRYMQDEIQKQIEETDRFKAELGIRSE
jgi:hypothetical protein